MSAMRRCRSSFCSSSASLWFKLCQPADALPKPPRKPFLRPRPNPQPRATDWEPAHGPRPLPVIVPSPCGPAPSLPSNPFTSLEFATYAIYPHSIPVTGICQQNRGRSLFITLTTIVPPAKSALSPYKGMMAACLKAIIGLPTHSVTGCPKGRSFAGSSSQTPPQTDSSVLSHSVAPIVHLAATGYGCIPRLASCFVSKQNRLRKP